MRKVPFERGVVKWTKGIFPAVKSSHPAVTFGCIKRGSNNFCFPFFVFPLLIVARVILGGFFMSKINNKNPKVENLNKYSVLDKIKMSANELSSPLSLAICGMLLALVVVLGYFANFSLTFLINIKISFNFLPIFICAMFFGPIPAAFIGGLGEFLSFFLNPIGGSYFPGWSINLFLVGFIYGLFYYKAKITFLRVLLCNILSGVLVNMTLGSLWLLIQFRLPFGITFGIRGLQLLIMLPIEVLVMLFINKLLSKNKRLLLYRS